MVKAKTGQLCRRASPAECGVCFPDIGASALHKRELFIKTLFDEVDMFVSPSHFLIDRYADWGLAADKLTFLENGLEIGEIAPPRPLCAGKPRRNRFAYFGQLNQFKGIKVLVEAVARVPAEIWGTDSVLCVFGGNLEVQPESFQQEFRRLVQMAGTARPFLRQLSQRRPSRVDARDRLGSGSLDLVGELSGGHPGSFPAWPTHHLQRHRRHGGKGASSGRRAALPRRQRREPGGPPHRDPSQPGSLGAAPRPHSPTALGCRRGGTASCALPSAVGPPLRRTSRSRNGPAPKIQTAA